MDTNGKSHQNTKGRILGAMPNNTRSLTIWFITDDKPGHQSQLRGLERSIQSRESIESLWLPAGFRASKRLRQNTMSPNMIIGAGHSTHKAVLYYAKKFSAFSVVLMKPSFPIRWFDAVICPFHDNVRPRDSVLNTHGVLNKIVPPKADTQKSKHTLLLGGPSKHFDWDEVSLIAQIRDVISYDEDLHWQVFNSRRTPHSLWKNLHSQSLGNIHMHDYQSDESPDLSRTLLESECVWVTRDSVSMVFEALTANAKVGLFDLVPSSTSSRVFRAVDQLVMEHKVVDFSSWHSYHRYSRPGELYEADRAAAWLLQRYEGNC